METKKPEAALAECPLNAGEKNVDKALLSNRSLWIFHSEKSFSFPLGEVNQLQVELRKKMGWVFLGGILMPLAIVAFLTHTISSGISLLFVLVFGFLCFYYGWRGQMMLTIYGKNYERRFPLSIPHKELMTFCSWLNGKLPQLKKKIVFFEYPVQLWPQALENQALHFPSPQAASFQPPRQPGLDQILIKFHYEGQEESIQLQLHPADRQIIGTVQGIIPLHKITTINFSGS
ncbi:hypothetical protein [Persicobacter sp. CCB-QB2]|uniref:hypothetical protein n=1 Tax=Persicobacter sp. CCB-QB2 TaxID=1561025 RepID=UPI0006A9EAB1|nr:hypothetical protein [Persicobacter sp. CCB-QB2]